MTATNQQIKERLTWVKEQIRKHRERGIEP